MSKPKIALLIGCNYTYTTTNLRNCTTDILQMKGVLIDSYQYDPTNIILLRDDDQWNMPTKNTILTNIKNIIENSYNYSEIWIHYVGHGSELKNYEDGIIVPSDYLNAGIITNGDLYNIIRYTTTSVKIILDCNQSTCLNLQYSYTFNKSNNTIDLIINNNLVINPLITLITRTTNRITEDFINLLRISKYIIRYSDILYNLPVLISTSQQLNMNINYLNYLYWNYDLLLNTVENLNKNNKNIEKQVQEIPNQRKINIKKLLINSKNK